MVNKIKYNFYALGKEKNKINVENIEEAKCLLKNKRHILILEDFYCKKELLETRNYIHNWGLNSSPSNIRTGSYHRIDMNHKKADIPHVFHYYILSEDEYLESNDLFFKKALNKTKKITDEMIKVQNIFLDVNPYDQIGTSLLCQVIHYPAGGGYFSSHDHDPKVQNIGLILSLSNELVDSTNEGLYFYLENNKVFVNEFHSLGDLIIFPYDILHGVDPIKPLENLKWRSSRGKWSLILPYL